MRGALFTKIKAVIAFENGTSMRATWGDGSPAITASPKHSCKRYAGALLAQPRRELADFDRGRARPFAQRSMPDRVP
jgi:hypothetical protein